MTIPHLTVEMHVRDIESVDVERLLRVLHEMGGVYVVVEHPETVAVPMPPDVPDPAPLPPHEPPVPWWERLSVTTPLTKIYADVDQAQVYYSAGPDTAPSFDQKALLSSGQPWTLPLGKSVDVWRAPLKLSGWICVAVLANRALWVRGEDMRATP